MLVKAAYVHPVRAEQDPYERAMFVLSQRDMALLGVEDAREFLAARGRGARRRLPEDEEGIANVTRGFVGRVMASGRRLRSAVGGDAADLDRALNYWLLLSAPLRDAEGHTIVGGRLRGFTVPVWNVLGVYPVLASEEDVEATTERLRQEDRSIFRHSYTEHMTRALLREAETEGEEFSLFLAYVYRQWGLLLGFPVCQALLVEGERLYDEQMRTGLWQPRLEAAYAIMGKTRRAVRDEYTVDMLPFGFAAREMSDTTEFESFGWDLPVAMLTCLRGLCIARYLYTLATGRCPSCARLSGISNPVTTGPLHTTMVFILRRRTPFASTSTGTGCSRRAPPLTAAVSSRRPSRVVIRSMSWCERGRSRR